MNWAVESAVRERIAHLEIEVAHAEDAMATAQGRVTRLTVTLRDKRQELAILKRQLT